MTEKSGVLVSFHIASAEYHLPLGFGDDPTEEIKPGEHVFLFCIWLDNKKRGYDGQGEIHGGLHAEPSRICAEIKNILNRFAVKSIHELIGMRVIAEKNDSNHWILKGPKS